MPQRDGRMGACATRNRKRNRFRPFRGREKRNSIRWFGSTSMPAITETGPSDAASKTTGNARGQPKSYCSFGTRYVKWTKKETHRSTRKSEPSTGVAPARGIGRPTCDCDATKTRDRHLNSLSSYRNDRNSILISEKLHLTLVFWWNVWVVQPLLMAEQDALILSLAVIDYYYRVRWCLETCFCDFQSFSDSYRHRSRSYTVIGVKNFRF